jgi:hypothetical protein
LPSQPSSIVELVSVLRDNPAPVIFLDTCAILDILDVPRNLSLYRDTASPALVHSVLNALQAFSETTPKLQLVISGQVAQEYTKNLPKVLKELRTRIAQITQVGDLLLSATDSAQLGSTLTTLEANLTTLTNRIFNSSLTIAKDDASVFRAASRLARSLAPAKRGSSNMGDCLVVEHFLEFVRQLRADGFDQKCIFVSSNYRDFGLEHFRVRCIVIPGETLRQTDDGEIVWRRSASQVAGGP